MITACACTCTCTIYPQDNNQLKVQGFPVLAFEVADNRDKNFIPFHRVNSSISHFDQHCNEEVINVADSVLNHSSHLCVFGGPPSLHLVKHFVSKLISPVASTITNYLDGADLQSSYKKNSGITSNNQAVKFSWYRISCNQDESLFDVLKGASYSSYTGTSSSNTNTTNVSDIDQCQRDYSLIMRDCGGVMGMSVPGLWEVDINTGEDILSMYTDVSSKLTASRHSDGCGHSVMTLTFTKPKAQAENGISNNDDSNLSIFERSSFLDPPDVCRVTFLFLADITPTSLLSSSVNSSTCLNTTSSSQRKELRYHWARQLSIVLDMLKSNLLSPSYHKSRLCLLLRDAFLGRQSSSFELFIHDYDNSNTNNSDNSDKVKVGVDNDYDYKMMMLHRFEWIKLMKQLSQQLVPTLNSSALAAVKASIINKEYNDENVLEDISTEKKHEMNKSGYGNEENATVFHYLPDDAENSNTSHSSVSSQSNDKNNTSSNDYNESDDNNSNTYDQNIFEYSDYFETVDDGESAKNILSSSNDDNHRTINGFEASEHELTEISNNGNTRHKDDFYFHVSPVKNEYNQKSTVKKSLMSIDEEQEYVVDGIRDRFVQYADTRLNDRQQPLPLSSSPFSASSSPTTTSAQTLQAMHPPDIFLLRDDVTRQALGFHQMITQRLSNSNSYNNGSSISDKDISRSIPDENNDSDKVNTTATANSNNSRSTGGGDQRSSSSGESKQELKTMSASPSIPIDITPSSSLFIAITRTSTTASSTAKSLHEQVLGSIERKQSQVQQSIHEQTIRELNSLKDALQISEQNNIRLKGQLEERDKLFRILQIKHKKLLNDHQLALNSQESYESQKEKERHKITVRKARELEHYKEVMEVSYNKMKIEKESLNQNNKELQDELITQANTIRKLRSVLSKAKLELQDTKPALDTTTSRLQYLEAEVIRLKEEKNVAVSYLARGQEEAYWRRKYSLAI